MRLLLFTDGWAPSIGGVEVLYGHYLRVLTARGDQVMVVTDTQNDGDPWHREEDGVLVHRLPIRWSCKVNDVERIVACARVLAQAKRVFRADVEYVVYAGPMLFLYLKTRQAHRAKMVLANHVDVPWTSIERGGILGRALDRADWVTTVSESSRHDLLGFAPEIAEKISVLYNALPQPAAPIAPVSFSPPVILCFGRLVEEKGFDLAIAAMARIVHRYPDARLIVAGDGDARPALEQQAREAGVADAVRFTGWVPPAAVPDLIDQASVVVVPSRWREPFGLVALQAMQRARPVVAAARGGLPEVVRSGETGLLVPSDDADALADGILHVLDDPDRAGAMGLAGLERARKRFGFERFIAEHDALYSRLFAD